MRASRTTSGWHSVWAIHQGHLPGCCLTLHPTEALKARASDGDPLTQMAPFPVPRSPPEGQAQTVWAGVPHRTLGLPVATLNGLFFI